MFFMAFILGSFVALFSVLPLRFRWYYRVILGMITYAAAFKGQIQHFFGGPMFFAPDLPNTLIRINSVFYGIIIFFAGVLLISLPFRVLYHGIVCRFRFTKETLEKICHSYNRMNLVLFIASLILASYSLYNGAKDPQVKVLPCAVQDLPEKAQGMKIVFLADLHIDKLSSPEKIRAIVEKSNALVPDLILLGGDLVDGTSAQYGKSLSELSALKAKYGVYAVPGNHEYYSGFDEWKHFLEKMNIKVLLNETVKLGNGLYLSGVTDPAAERFGKAMPDLEKVMKALPEKCGSVLLCHRPRETKKAARKYDLFLAGHTHGGMVWGLDLLVGRMNDNFYSGLYKVGDMDLYVSNGTVIWQGFPFRLGHPSEITCVILRKKKG